MTMREISSWASPEVKTITVTQEVGGTSYELRVREFVPQPGDSLERTWFSNGEHKSHKTANYAIANMRVTSAILQRFVHGNVGVTIAHSVNHADMLLGPTYRMALKLQTQAEVRYQRLGH